MTTEAIDLGIVDAAPVHDRLVELDGQTFRMVLTWRERQACWYLDLYAEGGSALIIGCALRPASPALLRRQGTQWPGGALMLASINGTAEACTLAGLDVTHELLYLPAVDISAWRASTSSTGGLTFEAP
jgi:hypothetical protein